MAKRTTTLFIEDTAIRFLVAKGKQAQKWASVALEPGLVKHGQIVNPQKLAEKLKETFKWAKIGNKVILGLSEPGSLYRIATLPKLPDAILEEAVKREAERVIPLPQDEIYLAYQTIATRAEDMQIFMAAFSRSTVDGLVNTLKMAGIKPYSLDLVPLALCRAVDKPTAIIVSLRSSNFEIVIMVDRIPQVIRSLSLPGEAEDIADKLPTIAEELERTVSFYNSSHTEKPLDNTVPVFVDGELTQVPESWPVLVGNLGSQVAPLPQLMQAGQDFEAAHFTVNVGLSFKENPRDVEGTVIDFNALPRIYRQDKPKLSNIIIPVGIGLAVIALVFLGLQSMQARRTLTDLKNDVVTTQNNVTQTTKDINNLTSQITSTQEKAPAIETQIAKTKNLAAAFTSVIEDMYNQRTKMDVNTNRIYGLLPTTVMINSLNEDDMVSIQGQAEDESSIFEYARKLTASRMFADVAVRSIAYSAEIDEEGNTKVTYQFQIAAK